MSDTVFSEHLAEETIALSGAARSGTVPAAATSAFIYAEGGAVYFSVNGTASANSGGYVPDGQKMFVGPLVNFDSVSFYGASGAKAHVQYYAET